LLAYNGFIYTQRKWFCWNI